MTFKQVAFRGMLLFVLPWWTFMTACCGALLGIAVGFSLWKEDWNKP